MSGRRDDPKNQLAEKRAKLEELRRAREQRRNALNAEKGSADGISPDRPASAARRAQLDELVSSLLSPSGSETPASSSAAGIPALQNGYPSGRTSRMSDAPAPSDSERDSAAGPSEQAQMSFDTAVSSVPDLTEASQPLFEITPKVRVTYDKGIQTTFAESRSVDDAEEPTGDVGSSTIDEAELRARILREIEAEKQRLDREIVEEKKRRDEDLQEERRRGLPPELLESIYASTDFATFLDSSTKVVQRALTDTYDYLRDYSIGGDASIDDSDQGRVKRLCAFLDARWTRGRAVTALDWSPKFAELSCAAYNKSTLAPNDPNGLVAVWNMHLLERPEYLFHSPSDVLSCTFSPFHPNFVIGGTYAGQILLWDTRAKSMPVLKTPLSATGHTHPVYSLSMVGTQNAHNLISASTDGTVCAWTLDMLARPQETLSLSHAAKSTDEVSITAIAFAENEAASFYVGTEEGNVFLASRYDRAGVKAGLVASEVYRGHSSAINGMHFHPLHGPVDFSDLFLTCGVDWTVKLWRARGQTTTNVPATAPSATQQAAAAVLPIYSFDEADDYILDVKWHPAHPAVFGTVDGSGKLDVWNLNLDTEVPTSSTMVAPDAPKGLNKLAWDRKEGRRVAVGSSSGEVFVYDIGNLATPAENEWETTRRTISQLLADRDAVGVR